MIQLLSIGILLLVSFSFNAYGQGGCTVTISINTNDTICSGQSVTLTASGGNGNSYNWQASAGPALPNQSNVTVTPNQTTTYIVSNNCGGPGNVGSDTIVITVLQSPNATVTNNNNVSCPGTPVNLIAGPVQPGNTFVWSTGQTGSSVQVAPTGNTTYTVTVTNSSGCTDAASINVSTLPAPSATLGGTFVDCGTTSNPGVFTFSNTSTTTGTNSSYFIDWGDGSSNSLPNNWNLTTHNYNLGSYVITYTVIGSNGCSTSTNYDVYYGNLPNGNVEIVSSNKNICFGDSLLFEITGYQNNSPGTTYIVEFNDGTPDLIFSHPPQQFFWHVFSSNSCGASYSNNSLTFNNSFGVVLTVLNPCGVSGGNRGPIYVSQVPDADFSISANPICVNTSACFTNTSTGGANIVIPTGSTTGGTCTTAPGVWTITPTTGWTLPGTQTLGNTFGVNDPSLWANGSNQICPTFTTPGVYSIKFKTSVRQGQCGADSVIKTICVVPVPQPAFSLNQTTGCAPFNVDATNSSNTLTACSPATYLWTVSYTSAYCQTVSNWSFSQGTNANSINPSFLFSNAGVYTITLAVTNVCGTFTTSQTVNVKGPPLVNLNSINSPCGPSPISPTYSATNCGASPLTYNWTFNGGSPSTSSSATPGSINFNTVGPASVSLQVGNECGISTSTTNFNVLPLPDANSGPDQTICLGAAVQLNGSSSTAGATFSWSPAVGLSATNIANPIASPSTTTTYTLTITSPNGCTASDQVIVTVNGLPNPQIATGSTCSGQPITITASGGVSYIWNTGATTANISVSPIVNTLYTVTATNTAGCTASTSATVTTIPLPVVSAGPDITLCDQPIPFSLTGFSPAGGTWSGSSLVTSGGVFTPNGTGPFTLTYTYTNPTTNCTNSDVMVVTVVTPQPANAGPDVSLCQNGPQYQLAGFSPSGGSWSGSPFVNAAGVFTPSTVGTYTLTYTFGTGTCLSTDNIQVVVNANPTVGTTGATICIGQTATLSATGGGTYLWSDGSTTSSINVTPSVTTTYTVTVTNASGCTSTGTATATVNPLPVVSAGPDITLCDQPIPFSLTGFSPAGGTWSGSTLVTSGGVFTPNGTGTFTLTYTYTDPSTGCINTDDLVVTVANPQLADAGSDFSICQNEPPIQLAGFSPNGGTWSGSTLVTSGGIFNPTTVGSFTLTYTYGTGTCLSSDDLVVTVNPLPTPSVNSPTICLNQQATLTVNGGLTYLWNTGDVSATITVSPNTTTTYTVTATNQFGCTASVNGTVTVNPLPIVSAGPDVSLCDQPIPYTLTGFSPLGGSWTGSTLVSTGGVFTPNGTGTFTLTYTYTDPLTGCVNSDDLLITVASPQLADAGPDFSICQNEPPIQLAGFSPNGGTWSGSTLVSSSGVFNPATVGSFTLTYTYGTGTCLSSDDLVVTVNPLPTPSVNNPTICLNQSATLTVTGGLSYLWNSGDITTSITVSPVSTTTYTVTATNQFGCTASVSGTVTVNPLPVVNAGNDTTYCYQGISVQLPSYASPTNGTWFGNGVLNANGLYDPSIPGFGSHYVYYTFTDGNNCTNLDSILVNIVLPSVADAGPGNVVCIDNGLFNLSGFSPSSGGSWSGPGIVNASSGLFDPTVSGVGTFLLFYEFGVGSCYTKDSTIVTVNPLPVVNAGNDIDTCISVPPFPLSGFNPVSGGAWSGNGVTPSGLFSPLLAGVGTHILIYEYEEPTTLCVNSDSITVQVNPLPVPDFSVDSVLCLNTPFTIVNNTTGAATYFWNFGDGITSTLPNPTHTYVQTGTYVISLVATSTSGCVDSVSFNVLVVVPPSVSFTLSTNNGCGPLLVDITNNSVSFNPSYLWDFGNGTTGTMVDPLPISYPSGTIGDTTYYITLSTTNLCGSATFIDSVLVRPSPTAYFGIDFNTGCSPLTIQFANLSYGLPTSYFWDFGDGTTSTDSLPVPHTYFAFTNDSTYYITLIVTNACGSDTLVDSVTVSPNTVNAFINATPLSGCQPLTVNFTNFSTGGSNFYWDFGDGNTSTGYSVAHTYLNPGTYTASFQIDNGCSYDTVYRNITVYPKPVIDFVAAPDTVCIGDVVQFTHTSSLPLTATLWNFGDGSSSALSNPQHAYAAPGTYNVTLLGIAAQSCSDTITKTVVVRTPPVVSAGFDTVYCNSNSIVNLSAPSPSGGVWSGVGIVNANTGTFNPSFVGVGTFQVYYNYTDVFGCSNQDTASVTVNPPEVAVAGSDTSVCINSTPFLLNGQPAGGTWSGTLVQSNGLVNPSIDGTFTMVYTYGVGSCLVKDSLQLTVHPLPILSTAGNPSSLCVNDSSISLLATPIGGTWSGPGLTGSVFDPSVTGAAQVNLVYTYTDGNGCVNTAVMPIIVNGLPMVTIANDTSYCLQPIPAQLPVATPAGGTWSGNGVTSATLGTFFPPNAGLGIHPVYYSYTDGNSCTNVDTILVTVNAPETVDAGPDTAVCQNSPAFVLVGSPLGGTWSGPFVQPTGNFIPSAVGTHQLIYTYGVGTCERKDTLFITVHPIPAISLAGNIVTHCVNDPAFSLIAAPLGGVWSGPGVVGNLFDPSIAGIGSPFVLNYAFVDTNGCANNALLNMTVFALPSVNAGNDTTVCNQNIAVSLFGNYGNVGTWTGTGVSANGVFFPQGLGSYPLVYTYTDPNGCTDSDTVVVTVIPPTFAEAGPGLTLCVDAGNITMPSFTPATGGIWYYPFGPGVVNDTLGIINPALLMQGATAQTSFVLYYQYGNGNCLTIDSTIVVVNPLPVVDAGSDTSSCITASPFNLYGFTPTGGIWSGIGIIDTLAGLFDPWLANSGTYQINYSYIDPITGCQNSDYRNVTVHPQPVADYDSSLFEGCQPLPVNFINQTTGATGYVWDFGDGNISTLSSPIHVYADSGLFNVTLYTESSFGCRDTAYGTVVVHPKPVADFSFAPPFSCISPVNVQIQNLSTDPTGSLWDFGAQGTSTFIDPSLTYTQSGSYPIQLISTSAFGCRDTMVKNYEVYPTPEAIPVIADPTACVGEPVPFTHASLNGVYYQWQFGDGDTTDIPSPIHIYNSPGVYTVQLVVVGAGGCSDTAIVQSAISVLNTPVASFNYVKDPDPYNYGLVHFTNGSSGGTTFNWDFGDGNTSPLVNPSHQYQNYGEYIVTLVVTNANGCADTVTQIIYVDYFKGLFVPNALTPEDGPEDVRHFLPKGRGLKRYRLEIFDSWGNLLWYSDKLEDGIPVEGWNGTRMDNGVLLPQDVYVWKIRAEFLDGSLWEGQERGDGRKRITGTITLIR